MSNPKKDAEQSESNGKNEAGSLQKRRLALSLCWGFVGVAAGCLLGYLPVIQNPSSGHFDRDIAIICAVVVGLGFGMLAYYQSKSKQEPKPTIAPSYMTLTITVPALAWKPAHAFGLMNALFPLVGIGPLTFRIVATPIQVTWAIVLIQQSVDTAKRAILSFYPHAEIAVNEATAFEYDAEQQAGTKLGGGTEYFAPLRFVVDHNDLDPLMSIVGAMTQLEEGEQVSYSVTIKFPEKEYQKEGRQKIHRSRAPGMVLAGLNAAVGNRTLLVSTGRSNDKYEARLQKAFEEKLDHQLVPATVRLHIRAQNPERFSSIHDSLVSAVSIFNEPQGNLLVNHPQAYSLVLSAQEVAALWHLPSEDIHSPGVVRSSGTKAPLPVELVQQKSGLLLGHNTYQGKTQPVYLTQADRITHMNITGKTRVGKTTFMHNLIHQDIIQGRGVGVIDPHGDLIQTILACSIPPEREKDVILFDLADVKHPVPLNLLYVPPGVQPHAAVGLTLGVLKKLFAEQWSATRMEDALYSALSVLADTEGSTIRDIPRLFSDATYRSTVLANANDSAALEYWREDYERMSERYQLEVARPILHRIRTFYRNPVIEQIVAQPVSLDFRAMMDEGKIFLASLAGEATQAEAATIGALLISKLQLAAMGRAHLPTARRRMFYLYIDEVQNFITTSLATMFSEAAKYALSLTVANQYLSQLEGGTLEAVLGNTGTTVMFACGNQDARDLGAYLKPTFDSQTLLNLDRFETIVKLQHHGKTLPAFSMQTLPPPVVLENVTYQIRRIREYAHVAQRPTEKPVLSAKQSVKRTATPVSSSDEVPDLDL